MRARHFSCLVALGIAVAVGCGSAHAADAGPCGELATGFVARAERENRCRLSQGEVAVLGGTGSATASQIAESKGIAGRTVAGGERFAVLDVGRGLAGIDFDDPAIAPVFRAGRGPDAPFLFPNGEVLVRFKLRVSEECAASWARSYGLALIRPLGVPRSFLLKAANPLRSLEAAAMGAGSDQVASCAPNWVRQIAPRQADPLYPYQWFLRNTGEQQGTVAGNDIDVESVWDNYRGAGQTICLVDDGLEIRHRDLAANVVPGLSWDFVEGDDDPTAGEHGTACGGVAAARGFNDIGVRGVAPEAGLCGHRIGGDQTTEDAVVAEAETRSRDRISIYNNSWGPRDDGQTLEGPQELTRAAVAQSIAEGRGGRGAIYVWAGGNGLTEGDNSNYDGFANWRYTIAVGASDGMGGQAYYSEPGANLCVNAPSKGRLDVGIATVDRTGPLGYNEEGVAQGNFADLDFTNDFSGTSSACPTVSGTCALMLQANPDLAWRDVKKILMTTATKNDPADADWTTNAAGYPVNHKYGFGRVDAAAAVAASAGWTNLPPEVVAEGSASPREIVPPGSGGLSSTVTLARNLLIESVEVTFTAYTCRWGDLSVVLTAPSGTSSVLAEKHDTTGSTFSYDGWRFGSERHLGEMSAGDWTLTVRDLGNVGGATFARWKLAVYGTDPGADAVSLTTGSSPVEGGRVSPAGSSRLYRGAAAGIRATPAPGYHFVEWVANPGQSVAFGFAGSKSPETTVTLSGDADVTARFSQVRPETATVVCRAFPAAGGLTDPAEPTEVNVGAGLAIATLPTSGYRFLGWASEPPENAEFAGAGSLDTIARIRGDAELTAVYRAPDLMLTQGSVVVVPASDLRLESFSKAPEVKASTGKKSCLMKVLGDFPSQSVTARWPAKPKAYDPAGYKDVPGGLGARLAREPIPPVPLQSLVVDAKKDGSSLDLAEVGSVWLAPPFIEIAMGELKEGARISIDGTYFGTNPPKIAAEYLKNGAYALAECTLVREFAFVDSTGNPSCMDPRTGRSAMIVVVPRLPHGAEPTGYLILKNPIGMCSFYVP